MKPPKWMELDWIAGRLVPSPNTVPWAAVQLQQMNRWPDEGTLIIKVKPRDALKQVRKPLAPRTKVKPSGKLYTRKGIKDES